MKKNRLQIFLEELTRTSNISISCERANLSRQTIYRWMDEDSDFEDDVYRAINFGVESINDLAESKLITHIKNGNQRSIEYWLNNHKGLYYKKRDKRKTEKKRKQTTFIIVDGGENDDKEKK